ncbi:hypothetical protein ACH4FX_36325 [Streptomyces sp. NPDC018019]|uniref:hypothetical protein n=1 Tax=Streptomyces sp. NPDC018019 TaxID=3365030 RepID=UPI0037A64A61
MDVRSYLGGPWDEEVTRSLLVGVEAEAAWDLLHRVTVKDVPMVRALLAARALPARLKRRHSEADGRTPLLEQLVATGFTPLASERPHHVALGRIGSFWRLVPEYRDAPTGEAFARFAAPGFAKAVLTFELSPCPSGTRITTTTRVRATDEVARRKFRTYWRLICWAGGAMRHAVLRAVARQAKSMAVGVAGPESHSPLAAPGGRGTTPEADR